MNDDEGFDLHRIISEGNRFVARTWLQAIILGWDVPDDVLLVDFCLTKIETIGVAAYGYSREALNQAYLLLENMPESCPERMALMARWQKLDDQYNRSV